MGHPGAAAVGLSFRHMGERGQTTFRPQTLLALAFVLFMQTLLSEALWQEVCVVAMAHQCFLMGP